MAVAKPKALQPADLVSYRRYLIAWAKMRGYETEMVRGHFCALRNDRHTWTWERVCIEPSLEEFKIMSEITKKDSSEALTVITSDPEPYKALGEQLGFDLLCDEAIMNVDLVVETMNLQQSAKKDDFKADTKEEKIDDLLVARLKITKDEKPAAKGDICIDDNIAIFDKISTEENMRRQGLGSLVMRSLGVAALGKGADKGWLIASAQGELLYEQLGWETACRLIAFGDKSIIHEASL